MTFNDYIKANNCENFQELKEKLCGMYPALLVILKDATFSHIFALNPKLENYYPSYERIQTINGIGFSIDESNLNGHEIEEIKPILKTQMTPEEISMLFNHVSNVFDDTFDFQVKYGLMTREEMFEKAPYFIQKDNLMMKIGHLEEELAEIKKAAENGDLVEFADGIIDLIYVASGLGNLCSLPMHQLWNDVQNSNMVGKERVTSLDNATKRGSTFDVRKTDKWVGPRGAEIIEHFSIGK
jgi:hypothetical protein